MRYGVRQSAVACVTSVRVPPPRPHLRASSKESASQPESPLGRISATPRPHISASHPSAASQPPVGRILCPSAASRVAAGEFASSSERAQVELGSRAPRSSTRARRAVRCGGWRAVRCGTVRWRAVACGTVRWRAVACGGVRWGAVGCGSLSCHLRGYRVEGAQLSARWRR